MPSSTEHRRAGPGDVIAEDLAAVSLDGDSSGAVWSLDSPQLNANLVAIQPGDSIGEHVNDAVDVLLVAQRGSGTVLIDDQAFPVTATSVVLIPRGARRSISSLDGLVYFSIHQRRGGGLSVGERQGVIPR